MGGTTTLWPSVSPCMLGKSKRWDETWEWCESSVCHSFIRFFQNKTKAKDRRKWCVFISITKMKRYLTHGFSISRCWAQLEHGQKRIRGEWSDLSTLIWGEAGDPEVFYYIYARMFFFFFFIFTHKHAAGIAKMRPEDVTGLIWKLAFFRFEFLLFFDIFGMPDQKKRKKKISRIA